jgi:hypothetical protein
MQSRQGWTLRPEIELINAFTEQSFTFITQEGLIRLATALPGKQGRGLRPPPVPL